MNRNTGFSWVIYWSALAIPFPASNMISNSSDWTRTEQVVPVVVSYHPLVPKKITCIVIDLSFDQQNSSGIFYPVFSSIVVITDI
jgi:hypothetical protein